MQALFSSNWEKRRIYRSGFELGRWFLMGNPRPRPQRIHEKLRQIRETMGISQPRMPERLGFPDMHPGRISEYETNKREPSLQTLLAYADLAGVHLEFIVNDDLELPDRLPGKVHYGLVPRHVGE